jgi:hypothetical protein
MGFVGHPELHQADHYDLAALGRHDLITFQRGSQPLPALLQRSTRPS